MGRRGYTRFSPRMRTVLKTLKEMKRVPAPPGLERAVLTGLRTAPREAPVGIPRGRRGLPLLLGMAGLGVVFAVGVAVWRHLTGQREGKGIAAVGQA